MSKCIYDLLEECNNIDCVDCVLHKIEKELEELKDFHNCPIEYDGGNDFRFCQTVNRCLIIIDKYIINKKMRCNNMSEIKFIITEREIINAVKCAIEFNIKEQKIVDILMRDVAEEIETVLYDDCEQVKE